MNDHPDETRDELIDRLIEGLSVDDELARAHTLIGSDPAARRSYVEHMHLVSALEMEKTGLAGSAESGAAPPRAPSGTSGPSNVLLLAACVALVLSLSMTSPSGAPPRDGDSPRDNTSVRAPPAHAETASSGSVGLARIVAADAPRFGRAGNAGSGVLAAGSYSLAEGALSLSFDNGVELALESPAEFELVHAKRVVLHRGKARARVPQTGIGFVIAAPDVEIEDLGTEFGVFVQDDRTTALRVFTGAVELQCQGREPLRIEEDSTAVLRNGRHAVLPEADDIVYLSAAQIGYRQWQTCRGRLRDDPSAVLYYDFDRDSEQPGLLRNRSRAGAALDGHVRGGLWLRGRWPEKGALLFENDGDCVEVDIPGEFDAFTFHSWLRVSRLEFPRQAIFGPKGWGPGKHNMHIFNTGELAVGINAAVYPTVQRRCLVGMSPVGRWFHFAISVDRIAGVSQYYIDGRCRATFPMTLDRKIVFGPSIVGGFALKPDASWPYDRQFRGWIDELALFGRAFSPAEIREMYECGRGFD